MGSSRVTATQAVAANLKVDASGVAVPVTDNGGSLTVDGTVTANAGSGTLAVSVASLPLPSGAATAALQAGGLPSALGSGGGLKVDGSGTALPVSGTVTANAGTNLNTSALALETTQAAGNVLTGAVTETAPATDTASSGLNGRLQRITQRLTSLIAVFNVGAGTEAAAVRVTLPTDGTGKVSAAQSGTWNVGTVTTVTAVTSLTNALPAGTNNIGDVDVLTMPGTGVEDAAETAGGTLVMAGTIRRDTAASSAGTTGDNATLNTDANGNVWVNGSGVTQPVGARSVVVTATPTLDTSAYASGDCLHTTVISFANAVGTALSGFVEKMVISDHDVQSQPCVLWLFSATVTPASANAAHSISDAHADLCIGSIYSGAYEASALNSVATTRGVGLAIKCAASTLYGILVTKGTPTYTASGLVVSLQISQD